ncbi:MAG: hypothetical protein ACYSWR_04355, partial [Planctomycetota bacterium]
QGRGGDEFQTAGILEYFEDLKRGTNKDIGPKDIFEIASYTSLLHEVAIGITTGLFASGIQIFQDNIFTRTFYIELTRFYGCIDSGQFNFNYAEGAVCRQKLKILRPREAPHDLF